MSNMYVNEPRTSGKVCLETTLGDIDVELWSRECPLACRNFVQLALEGFYDNTIFHRLQKEFMVQGGDPTGTGEANDSIYGEPFKSEIHQRLSFNRRGLLGCAGTGENGSQFFFTLGPATDLTKKHTLFGKVTGNTVFNLLRFNDSDTDKNDRPVPEQRVLRIKVLDNPFPDIVPREKREIKRARRDKKEKKPIAKATKNTSLLSFGDEAEFEEEVAQEFNEKVSRKGKSAHDVLDDEKLSKTAAVAPEELSAFVKEERNEVEDEDDREKRLQRVKEKLNLSKRKAEASSSHAGDDDIVEALDAEKKRRRDEEKSRLADELLALQKEYAKSIRQKDAGGDEHEKDTEAMQAYKTMKLKFKSKTNNIVKQADPNREAQTMQLLGLLKTRLKQSSVQSVMSGRKAPVSEQPLEQSVPEATSEDQGKLDETAQDMTGDDWMKHKLIAPEDKSGVTKAKDANMKGANDDEWYEVGDVRNKMAQKRRDGLVE